MPIAVNVSNNNPQVRSQFDARCIGQNLDPLNSAAYRPKPEPILMGWPLGRIRRSSILTECKGTAEEQY